MPKFGCRCGYTISLVSVPSPHESSLITDSHFDEFCERRTARIDKFLAACRAGNRNEWIANYFGHDLFDLSDGSIIDDILTREDVYSVGITTCPECGRLYRQRARGENIWDCFTPEPE